MDPTVVSLVQLLARMERIQQETENALVAKIAECDQLRATLETDTPNDLSG